MKRLACVLALCVAVAGTATARIGDSAKGCEQRYGRAVRVSDLGDIATYHKGRLSVVVHFTAGVADMVSFRKLPMADTPVSHRPAPLFKAEEIQTLLAESAGKAIWVEASSTDKAQIWAVADGSLYAYWDRSLDSLTIYTAAYAQSGTDV